jgi:uncharacterized RDD family membrane protein YckC
MNKWNKISAGKRLLSVLLDFLSCILIAGILVLIFAYPLEIIESNIEIDAKLKYILLFYGFVIVYPLAFLPFFVKDIVNGRSFIKRLNGIVVLDEKTKLAPKTYQHFLRNITMIIWPIEIIWITFTPEKRLGDHLAGTFIANYDQSLESNFNFNSLFKAITINIAVVSILVGISILLAMAVNPNYNDTFNEMITAIFS